MIPTNYYFTIFMAICILVAIIILYHHRRRLAKESPKGEELERKRGVRE